MEATKQLLGVGRLNWNRGERITDRYGAINLWRDEDNTIALPKKFEGQIGQLIAVVKETRQSTHIGDLFRGLFPITPKVGETFVLGEGAYFTNGDTVGLRPDDRRNTDWLDPEILYKLHAQTVELYFQPTKG